MRATSGSSGPCARRFRATAEEIMAHARMLHEDVLSRIALIGEGRASAGAYETPLTYTRRVRFLTRPSLPFVFLLSTLAAAASLPTPESVLGFRPGADYKLATYDQSVDYFKKVAAASKYVKLVEAGKTSQGRTMYFALVSIAGQPVEDRSLPRDRAAARASAGAERRRSHASSRATARRSSTSTAACTRPRSPARSTRRSCSTTSCSRANDPDIKAILDNVVADAVADDQPGRPADGGRVVHEERRHAVRAVGAAAAVSGIRRPRQQPRRLHAEHDRVARARAHVAAVGAADHLRAPPVGTVPDAHLAAAVLRAGRHRRAVPDVARSEHDRHGDRERPRGARPGRRDAHGHGVRRVVSRATSTTRRTSRTSRRSGPRRRSFSTRRRTSTRINDFPQNMRDLRPQSLYSSPWPPGLVAPARRGRLHGDRVAVGARVRREVQGLAAAQSLQGGTRSDRARRRRRRRTRTSSRSSSAIRWPPSNCCAASRSAACASRSSPATVTVGGDTFPAGTWVVPTDQEFAAMAREVLDVQTYPDLRQYPGGPPERPYDAAGWTLPLQMGVRVVAADRAARRRGAREDEDSSARCPTRR